MHYLIKRPLITEKNSWLAEKGVYVFEVDKGAEKTEIKKAVEKFFSVKVASVRTAVCRGRSKKRVWEQQVPRPNGKKHGFSCSRAKKLACLREHNKWA